MERRAEPKKSRNRWGGDSTVLQVNLVYMMPTWVWRHKDEYLLNDSVGIWVGGICSIAVGIAFTRCSETNHALTRILEWRWTAELKAISFNVVNPVYITVVSLSTWCSGNNPTLEVETSESCSWVDSSWYKSYASFSWSYYSIDLIWPARSLQL